MDAIITAAAGLILAGAILGAIRIIRGKGRMLMPAALAAGTAGFLMLPGACAAGEIREMLVPPAPVQLLGTCDGALTDLITARRLIRSQDDVEGLIREVRNVRPDCRQSGWNPRTTLAPGPDMCGHHRLERAGRISGSAIPTGLMEHRSETRMVTRGVLVGKTIMTRREQVTEMVPTGAVGTQTMMDRQGNALVHWAPGRQPENGANCWMYRVRNRTWYQE